MKILKYKLQISNENNKLIKGKEDSYANCQEARATRLMQIPK